MQALYLFTTYLILQDDPEISSLPKICNSLESKKECRICCIDKRAKARKEFEQFDTAKCLLTCRVIKKDY